MRGRLPLPLIPGQTAGGGVPDAPRRGQDPFYGTERIIDGGPTPGPGMPGPYRAAARERLPVSTPRAFPYPHP